MTVRVTCYGNVLTSRAAKSVNMEKDKEMPDYSKMPPVDQQRMIMPIVRVRPNQPLKVVIRSQCWYGRNTHYVNKRTVLCGPDDFCGYCDHHRKAWKAFAIVRAFSSERTALLSMTPPVIPRLVEATIGRQFANGLVVCFRRVGKEINSPLDCETFGILPNEPAVTVEETRRWVETIFRDRSSYVVRTAFPTAG